MKRAAIASIMALAAVLGLAACNREPAPVAAEAPAEAFVGKDVVLYLPDPVMKARVEVSALSPYVNAAATAAEGAVAPIPRDWYAHFSEDGGVLDDALMARVWPD